MVQADNYNFISKKLNSIYLLYSNWFQVCKLLEKSLHYISKIANPACLNISY